MCTTSRPSAGKHHVHHQPRHHLPGLSARERPRGRAQPRPDPAGRRHLARGVRDGRVEDRRVVEQSGEQRVHEFRAQVQAYTPSSQIRPASPRPSSARARPRRACRRLAARSPTGRFAGWWFLSASNASIISAPAARTDAEREVLDAYFANPSCPALCRASTSFCARSDKDVDGRDEPGHDGGVGQTLSKIAVVSSLCLNRG